jgi:dipeptidyl aminopeptidase/acylaminoacyl peptidase
MPILSRRYAALLLCAAALSPTVHAAFATTAPPPIEDFFGNPEFSGALLSPSGKFLAVRVGARGQRERLAVVDLSNMQIRVVGSFSDADIGEFTWVNDQRLSFSTTDRQSGLGDMRYAPGLYAVNRDGELFRQLVNRSNTVVSNHTAREILPWNTYLLGQANGQDSDSVYVTHPKITGPGQIEYVDLQLLNTLNGHTKYVERPGDSVRWLLDNKGEPRVTVTRDKGVSTVHYRDPATQQWRKLVAFDTYTGSKGSFSPLAFGPDGTFYVVNQSGQDKTSVHTFDFATNTVTAKALIELQGYDFRGRLIMDQHKLLGVRYVTDGEDTMWFDPTMKAMQEKVNALLPSTVNLLTLPSKPESPWVLVNAYSDRVPRTTLVYNSATEAIVPVGASHPNIKAADMGQQSLIRYKARDGLEIPALLTLPNGQDKHLPLVVLVHGGPYVRGASWGWNADAQFLASRGYAVLQPEFRGSTGFGARHFRAGWKQWGLKMQDDIADGAKWAAAQGIADAKRICIAGANYGGYAALMGLVNDPDVYQCGIDWAGMTDINLMYDGHWTFTSDLPEGWKQYGMPQLVGDQVKDADQLKATSPLEQAARIKQPLLLAYGGADRHVPLYHGTKFYNAVKTGNAQVEWVEYPEEGHGWALPKNRIDFWHRVERFLDKHIGQHASEQGAAAPN